MKQYSGNSKLVSLLPNNYLSLLKIFVMYFRKEFTFSLLVCSVVSCSSLLPALVSAYVFAHIQDANSKSFTTMFILFISFLTFLAIFSFLTELYIKSTAVKVTYMLMPLLLKHILTLPVSAFNQDKSGNSAQGLIDYETAITMTIKTSISLILGMLTLIILLIYMIYCDWRLALLYFVICTLFLILKILILPVNFKYIFTQLLTQGKISAFLQESLLKIHTIRSANVESKIFHNWLYKLIDLKIWAEKSNRLEIITGLFESIVPAILVLSVYTILYFSASSINSLLLLQFLVCSSQFSAVFTKISNDFAILIHASPGFKRMQIILQTKSEVHMDNKLTELNGDISFSHVSHKNNNTNNLILSDISFNIKPGEFIAFTGKSGAGKSTLFRLLLGLEQPSTGEIKINGINIKYLNLQQIRKQFGVVLQTTNLFPGTIFSNIATNANITLDQAWELAANLGLADDIKAMPMKMHTYISDNAEESLSGGQKQKILIARALAMKPTILLLDEATSALDNKSQDYIQRYLQSLKITRLVIAHRLSTIKNADRIYALDSGKMADVEHIKL